MQQLYPESTLKEAMIWSCKGAAATLIIYFSPDGSVNRILVKLETVCDIVGSSSMLMQNLYRIEQDKKEKVWGNAARLQGALNQNRFRFPFMICKVEMECHLRVRLFCCMNKTLQDSLQYLNDDCHNSYTQLMLAACKAETEVLDRTVGATTVKARAATTQGERNSELETLCQQMANLMSMMTRNQSVGDKARTQSNNNQYRGNGSQSNKTVRTTNQRSTNVVSHQCCWTLQRLAVTHPVPCCGRSGCYSCKCQPLSYPLGENQEGNLPPGQHFLHEPNHNQTQTSQ